MKKLTAIVLALVIALSVAVTAFAASTYECPHCFAIVEGEKEYNQAIREAQRNLKTLKSELKAIGFYDWAIYK